MKNGRQAPLRFCRENLFMRKLPALLLTLLLLDVQNILFWDGSILLDHVRNSCETNRNATNINATNRNATNINVTNKNTTNRNS